MIGTSTISMPGDLFADVAPMLLAGWRARVAAESGGMPPPLYVGSVGVPFVIGGERPDGRAGTERRHRGTGDEPSSR
jgi:hypothetical protein